MAVVMGRKRLAGHGVLSRQHRWDSVTTWTGDGLEAERAWSLPGLSGE